MPFPGFNPAQFLLLLGGDGGSPAPEKVQIVESGGSTAVTENGADDSYYIVLGVQPASTVQITVTPPTGLTVNGSTTPIVLTFEPDCPANCWFTQQTIQVAAVNDGNASGLQSLEITHSVSSTDSNFSALSVRSVTVLYTDDDVAAVSVDELGSVAVTEAGANDTYSLVLTSEPLATVTVTVQGGTQLEVNGGSTANLTFDAACPGPNCWSTPQIVTVSAVDDAIAEGAHSGTITHSVSSAQVAYNGIAVNQVSVSIVDNDSAGVSIAESSGNTSVTEGGVSDGYTVVLTSQPTASVQITLTADAQTQINGSSSATLTFDTTCPGSQCWYTPQIVYVDAVDDGTVEGAHAGTITHAASSSDAFYHGTGIAAVNVSITDNDGGSVILSATSLNATEGGANDSYTIVLGSAPTANVVVSVAATSQVTVNAVPFQNRIFTTVNWSTPQSITVAAVDDTVAESSPHAGYIFHSTSSADPLYNDLSVPTVTANLTDNDQGVVITESAFSTAVVESGATDSYSVVLTNAPTDDVIVTITPDNQIQTNGSALPIQLTFTTGNWNVAQTVTVSANNDGMLEGTHTGLIDHSVSSTDGAYNAIPVPTLQVRVDEPAANCTTNYTPDCFFGLALWVKADRSSVTATGLVSRLEDLSGTIPLGLIQINPAKRPAYAASTLNGKPVLTYSGGQSLNRNDAVVTLGNFTVCTVFQANPANTGYIYEHGNISNATPGGSVMKAGDTTEQMYVRRTNNVPADAISSYKIADNWATDNTWRTVCQSYGGTHATHQIHIDGVQSGTAGSTADPDSNPITARFDLGSRSDAVNALFNFQGQIAEMVVYSRRLTDADREKVQCYLRNKYALSTSHSCSW
ncbi:MAG: hypothetical protein HS115_18675 [Spirochaetales bacterium]|nr:hypothetical protein [Spirochaetales bacterium]